MLETVPIASTELFGQDATRVADHLGAPGAAAGMGSVVEASTGPVTARRMSF